MLPIILVLLAVLLIASQLLLPGYVAGRIESRLTENGGTAAVSVHSLPAIGLLFGRGDELDIRAHDLRLDIGSGDKHPFEHLDKLGKIQIAISRSSLGPFRIGRFDLTRGGSGPYHLIAQASVSVPALAGYGAGAADAPAPLAGLIAGVASQALPGSLRDIPVSFDMELESHGGTIQVVSGGGTIAGYPTGPLAELITSAIPIRL